MGNAKWWVCGDCKSLNDLPANKCYNCRHPKPSQPMLIDDQYDQVSSGSQKRVGISVDLSQVGSLVSRDPLEQSKGGGIIEAFNVDEDASSRVVSQTQAATPSLAGAAAADVPPLIRPPKERSIAEVGGVHWDEAAEAAAARSTGTVPGQMSSAGELPSAGTVSGPGLPPPPPPYGYPPLPAQPGYAAPMPQGAHAQPPLPPSSLRPLPPLRDSERT